MDQDLIKIVEENNKLIKENIELTKKNTKKIKKVHAYMRRTFITKLIYWVIIILVAAGAFYTVRPHVLGVVDSYNSFQDKIGKTTDMLDNPTSMFSDIGILKNLFNLLSKDKSAM